MLLLTVAVAAAAISAAGAALPRKQVRWYLAADDNRDLAIHRAALTGVYSCCGGMHIDSSGAFRNAPDAVIRARTEPYLSLGLTVEHVLAVDNTAVLNGKAAQGIEEACQFAVRNNLTGYMLDYMHTPEDIEAVAATMYGTSIFFKDKGEATKFSVFLNAFTDALHQKGRTLVVNLDTWKNLDYFALFAKPNTIVTKSAVFGTDLRANKKSVTQFLHSGIKPQQLSVAVGSMLTAGCNGIMTSGRDTRCYQWNHRKLHDFVSWLDANGVMNVDIWRADVDRYGQTEAYYFHTLTDFLATPSGTMVPHSKELHSSSRQVRGGVLLVMDAKLPLSDAQALDPERQSLLLKALGRVLQVAPGALALQHISEFGSSIVIEIRIRATDSAHASAIKQQVQAGGFRQRILRSMGDQSSDGLMLFGGVQFAFPQQLGGEAGDFGSASSHTMHFGLVFFPITFVGAVLLAYGSQGMNRKHAAVGTQKRNRSLADVNDADSHELTDFDEDTLLLIDDD